MWTLRKGRDYEKLKKCFVIFICPFDPFDESRYIYHFENRCVENPNLRLGDDAFKVFVNSVGTTGDVPDDFKKLMDFINKSELTKNNRTNLTEAMFESLQNARTNKEWRHDYMTLEEMKIENLKKGLEIGRKEGREKETDMILSMHKEGISIESIARIAKYPVSTIQRIIDNQYQLV